MPLIFLKSKAPFSPALQQSLGKLWEQCPPRVRAANLYLRQVPREEWEHGRFTGWSNNGSIELKAGEWTKTAGLGMHEMLHYVYQAIMTPVQREEWAAWSAKHAALLPTDYARKGGPDEAMAESAVAVYRKPLPKGYRKAGAELEKIVRHFAEGAPL